MKELKSVLDIAEQLGLLCIRGNDGWFETITIVPPSDYDFVIVVQFNYWGKEIEGYEIINNAKLRNYEELERIKECGKNARNANIKTGNFTDCSVSYEKLLKIFKQIEKGEQYGNTSRF